MDHWFWYDAATQSFPLQKDHLLDLLNHRLAKYIAIALGAVALLYGAYKRNAADYGGAADGAWRAGSGRTEKH